MKKVSNFTIHEKTSHNEIIFEKFAEKNFNKYNKLVYCMTYQFVSHGKNPSLF